MNKTAERNHQKASEELAQSKYSKISINQRKQLIDMVLNEGFSVYRAAKILGINNSTGKVILRNFKKKGHIFRRKQQKEVMESSSEQEQLIQNIPSEPQCPSTDLSPQPPQLNDSSADFNYYPFLFYPNFAHPFPPLLIVKYGQIWLTDL